MKAIVIMMMLLTSSTIFAAKSGNTYYAIGFEQSVRNASNMEQYNTKYNYSCGPTSMLFVANYHIERMYGYSGWFSGDIMSARYMLNLMYDDMRQRRNTITGTSDLKNLAKRWRYRDAAKASGSNSWETNRGYMANRLRNNQPVIVALYGNYSPVGEDHIVIIYKYDDSSKRFYYFDPYYGRFFSKTDASMRYAVQGNLPYLALVP